MDGGSSDELPPEPVIMNRSREASRRMARKKAHKYPLGLYESSEGEAGLDGAAQGFTRSFAKEMVADQPTKRGSKGTAPTKRLVAQMDSNESSVGSAELLAAGKKRKASGDR
ncbi:MAG: hypothetical protein Q9226_008166 [Calogaya cf. arnoldii]